MIRRQMDFPYDSAPEAATMFLIEGIIYFVDVALKGHFNVGCVLGCWRRGIRQSRVQLRIQSLIFPFIGIKGNTLFEVEIIQPFDFSAYLFGLPGLALLLFLRNLFHSELVIREEGRKIVEKIVFD